MGNYVTTQNSVMEYTEILVYDIICLLSLPLPPLPFLHCSVASCCFAPNGWILLTGSTAGELLVFNAFNGNCLVRKLGAHDMGIDGIANDPFQLVSSADVQKFGFASCGRDGMVKLWTVDCSNANQGKYVHARVHVCTDTRLSIDKKIMTNTYVAS